MSSQIYLLKQQDVSAALFAREYNTGINTECYNLSEEISCHTHSQESSDWITLLTDPILSYHYLHFESKGFIPMHYIEDAISSHFLYEPHNRSSISYTQARRKQINHYPSQQRFYNSSKLVSASWKQLFNHDNKTVLSSRISVINKQRRLGC